LKQSNAKIMFSFVIINYNSFYYTNRCILSIKKFCKRYLFEIIVIDNASSDNSAILIEKKFNDLIFIKNDKNFGFARACNQGIDRANGEFLVFLNNDFEFTTDIFDSVLEKFSRYENLGLLGFQLLNPNGTLQRTGFIFPTILRRILQITIIPLLRKHTSVLKPSSKGEDQVVDYIKGALMIVPAKLLHRLHLRFDENYFMYHEEMDLAYQLRKYEKICLLDSTPAGIHYGMHFEDVCNEQIFLWRHQNYLYFFKKNYGSTKLLVLIFINTFIFSLKWIFSLNNNSHRAVYRKIIRNSLDYLKKK